MLSSLDDLFGQIVLSERKAQERKSYLNEIRSKITTKQERIKELEEQNSFLNKDLSLKVYELSEEELGIKWLCNKEEILVQQKKILKEKKTEYQIELECLDDQLKSYRDKFIIDVSEFVAKSSFLGDGFSIREENAKKELSQLQAQQICLQKEIDQYSKQKGKVERLARDLEKSKDELNQVKDLNKETDWDLTRLQRITKDKEAEKNNLSCVPQTDPEFLSLHSELQKLKSEKLEERCQALQQELQQLQQNVWKKQLKDHQQALKTKYSQSQHTEVGNSTGQLPTLQQDQDDGIGDYTLGNLHLLFEDDDDDDNDESKCSIKDQTLTPSTKKRKSLFKPMTKPVFSSKPNEL